MVSKRKIMLNNKEVAIRSYEVSIWSLQDSFLTVLKWANIDNKGQIQQPEVTLDVDGTQNFSFSIPMYLGKGIENPAWHNTLNGNLMIGMRKIKVILNKQLDDEAVFEFIITKVTERHEADTLFCDVECEGLAFHELGKIGYKVALSQDLYLLDYEDWWNNTDQSEEAPRQTLQYWNDKTGYLLPYPENESEIIPHKWYYKVEMNWSSYNGNMARDSEKVYEDEYVAAWQLNQDVLVPERVENMREKERPVEIQESNMYNVTQKIAESFGVYCKYQYGYDANYHIISRTVIYYNNFIEEEHGHMDLTYPYHTSEITREMDSSELTTKLFVRPVDYEYSDGSQVTIMSVDANKSREDYILNFDYLHKFNIITDEQYEAIADYEKAIREINLQMEYIEPRRINLNNKITEYEAKLAVAETGVDEAAKQYNLASDHISALQQDKNMGVVHITQGAPKSVMVLTDETDGSYCVKMPVTGIIPSTIQLFDGTIDHTKTINQLENDYTALVQGGALEYDDKIDDLIRITHLPRTVTKKVIPSVTPGNDVEAEVQTVPLSSSLWLVCDYIPYTHWVKVRDYWEDQEDDIADQIDLYKNDILPDLKDQLETLDTKYKNLLDQKQGLIREFEEMMGPALRESYWQPENYQDYGNKYLIKTPFVDYKEGKIQFLPLDEQYYDGCSKVTYYSGPRKENYLAINLGAYGSVSQQRLEYIKNNYDKLYFIYYDVQGAEQYLAVDENQKPAYLRNALRMIKISGEDCRFGYIKLTSNATNNDLDSEQVYFSLIVEASKNMTNEQALFMRGNSHYSEAKYKPFGAKIGVITFDENTGEATIDTNAIPILYTDYIFKDYDTDSTPNNGAVIEEVYPRIIIDSLALKTGNEFLSIKVNDKILEAYKDYDIFVATDLNDNIEDQHDKYFIQPKIEALLKVGSLNPLITLGYQLSNADTLIYLDALQVAKENSEPKVSYTISLSLYDPYIIHDIYNKLSKIVHINDVQLKFENVQGYISQIEMHLDMPWEDTIEIKNYKTKFEDLFSNIVAQTDAMQKKSHNYDTAAAAFTPSGSLTSDTVVKILNTNAPIFNTYIDERLSDSPALKGVLTGIFNEAGQILGSAGNALSDIRSLTSANASILANFSRDTAWGLSQVQINENGIFIGSDQRISLFSGNVTTPDSGVSIDLSPERLILGASSGTNSTAAKFTDKYLVLAAGDVISDSEQLDEDGEVVTNLDTLDVNGTINGLVGAKFTSNSIGLATLNNGNINSILMNDRGITLGSGKYDEEGTENQRTGINLDQDTEFMRLLNITDASYVRISGSGIDIGSGGELYVNTNNFVVNSGATSDNSIFELKKKAGDWTESNNKYDVALSYNEQDGLFINGRLSASSLIIEQELQNAPTLGEWINAKVTPEAIWLGVKRATEQPAAGEEPSADRQTSYLSITNNNISILSGGSFNIKSAGNLSIESGGKLSVTASNIIINTDAAVNESIFQLKNSSSTINYFNIKRTGESTVAAELAGWSIANGLLYSGANTDYVGLCSSNDIANYAIWAGQNTAANAPFAVMRNGQVYLNKLMVLDPDKSLPGDHVQKGDEWFTAIDFSRLNFKQAVSVTGSWDGGELQVKVSLWGVLNKSVNMSAGVEVSDITSLGYMGHNLLLRVKITQSINGEEKSEMKEIGTVEVPDNYKDYVWGLAAREVSYTSGAQTITVPVSGMGNTDSYDISDTYTAGQDSMKLSRSGRTISVSSSGSSTSMTVSSGISMSVSGNTVTATGYAYVDGTRVDSSSSSRTVSGGSSGGCFAAGTPILLADYTVVPIEQLRLGTKIIAYDETTQSFKQTGVELLQHIHDRDLNIVDIYLSSGQIITMTAEHPLLTINGWKALDLELAKDVYGVDAALLQINDQFVSVNGENIFVIDIIKRPDLKNISVYHLDAEPYDTFVVNNIVAHNADEVLPK